MSEAICHSSSVGVTRLRNEQHEQVVIDHRAVVVAVQAAAAFLKNRAPEKDGSGQRNQTEQRAQKIVPAISERILDPEIKDREIFLERHGRLPSVASSTASWIAAIMLSGRAIPLPAMSNAVP